MASTVYHVDMRAQMNWNLLDKLAALLKAAGLAQVIRPQANVAVKLHFGEKGNTAYIRPVFIRRIVEEICALGGNPYLTDTCTLYRGSRETAPKHLKTAVENGFSYAAVGAPLIIADGIRGATGRKVQVDLPHKKSVPIAAGILDADCLVVVSHFKCHEIAGFGGALKNLGMGCSTKEGKLDQHAGIGPIVTAKKCVACGTCVPVCKFGAIALAEDNAVIDEDKCVGCGECIVVCPELAITIRWVAKASEAMEKMIEHAYGAVKNKEERCLFVNFITRVSPACDCYPHADMPIVPDLGILASTDPVALDRACCDLVNNAPGLPGSALKTAHEPGKDKFKDIYPQIDWPVQFVHAEAIRLGTTEYELVPIVRPTAGK